MRRENAYHRWVRAAQLAREAEEFFHRARELIQQLELTVELGTIEEALHDFAKELRVRVPRPVYYRPTFNDEER